MNTTSKAPLLIIFLTVFIDLLGFGIVLPLLPRYARYFEAGDVQLGLLMASFSAMQFLFAPLWGRVSDRVGRRPILLLGLFGSTLFYSLFGYATSLGPEGELLGLGALPWLFIGRIGAGIAGATIPTAQAYIADVTGPENRAKGMALIGAAFGIGFTFGPLLGAGFVSGDVGDPATLNRPEVAARLQLDRTQQAAIASEITAFQAQEEQQRGQLTRKAREKLRQERDQRVLALFTPEQKAIFREWSAPSAAPGYLAGVLSGLAFLFALARLPESLRPNVQAEARHWLELSSLRSALSVPSVALILFTMFLTTFAFAQFESTLSLLTYALGLADKYNYYVFAYVGFVLSLAQGVLVRRLVPRVGEFVMSVVGTVLMTLGFVLIGLAGEQESKGLLLVVLPVCVVGFSALTPSLQALLSRRSSESHQGGILGVGQSMSALARILGPMCGALLSGLDITYPYWSAALIMSMGVLLTLGLRDRREAAARPAD